MACSCARELERAGVLVRDSSGSSFEKAGDSRGQPGPERLRGGRAMVPVGHELAVLEVGEDGRGPVEQTAAPTGGRRTGTPGAARERAWADGVELSGEGGHGERPE